MKTRRLQLSTWLLLLVFSMQAVAPGMSARWLLCLGCDETGFGLEAVSAAKGTPTEACCVGESASQEPEFRADDCECVQLAFDSVGPSVWAGSKAWSTFDVLAPVGVVMTHAALLPGVGGLGERGPPCREPPPIEGSLLSQRTCLLI